MTMVGKISAAGLVLALLLGAGCRGPRARSERSFDEIQALARGKTAAQILALLGEPDSRQVVFDADERWIWWNYTFLDGEDLPPELRGQVVHLEITFERSPDPSASGESAWRISGPLGVSYSLPARS